MESDTGRNESDSSVAEPVPIHSDPFLGDRFFAPTHSDTSHDESDSFQAEPKSIHHDPFSGRHFFFPFHSESSHSESDSSPAEPTPIHHDPYLGDQFSAPFHRESNETIAARQYPYSDDPPTLSRIPSEKSISRSLTCDQTTPKPAESLPKDPLDKAPSATGFIRHWFFPTSKESKEKEDGYRSQGVRAAKMHKIKASDWPRLIAGKPEPQLSGTLRDLGIWNEERRKQALWTAFVIFCAVYVFWGDRIMSGFGGRLVVFAAGFGAALVWVELNGRKLRNIHTSTPDEAMKEALYGS
ncbi:hypothetical protein P154DRAFT_577254 [Amniculicola lignicola CBS 123094]|uniref:Uncharacterized protein n=1 Tax=Amniculicola lignicola CBS 123094 TaxID=1392246 RepID=A0A6A5WG20_9PLEO|nr:hypothetical protein P154DRAFT_577254 [Amniculicola lignicola CBS 123094]